MRRRDRASSSRAQPAPPDPSSQPGPERRGPLTEPAAAPMAEAVEQELVDAVYCPECGLPAWVEWSDTVRSTSGDVAMAKVRCFARHWFLMPADRLPR